MDTKVGGGAEPEELARRVTDLEERLRREGNSIFYRRSELGQHPDLEALQHSIFATVDELDLPADIQHRLAALHRQREENSGNFFRLNAHKFQQQRDLIASYEQYADVVAQVLASCWNWRRCLSAS